MKIETTPRTLIISFWGCLLVQDDLGEIHTVIAGDVSLRGSDGRYV